MLEAAQKDPLTGLYNRAYFESALRRRIEFAHRRTDTVAVALIDVDRFKEVNDTQGHGMGDLALQQIARLLASQGRETDVIARYGGDEFAMLMPGTSVESAVIVADRIRQLVEVQNVADIPLTLSIGIAACPADATTLPTLIDLADEAMYRAKDAGGNAVRRYARAGGGPTAPPRCPRPRPDAPCPERRPARGVLRRPTPEPRRPGAAPQACGTARELPEQCPRRRHVLRLVHIRADLGELRHHRRRPAPQQPRDPRFQAGTEIRPGATTCASAIRASSPQPSIPPSCRGRFRAA